jgi:hypothetical protein
MSRYMSSQSKRLQGYFPKFDLDIERGQKPWNPLFYWVLQEEIFKISL